MWPVCLSIQILGGFSEVHLHYCDNKSWCDMEIFKIVKYGRNFYILLSILMCHLCLHSLHRDNSNIINMSISPTELTKHWQGHQQRQADGLWTWRRWHIRLTDSGGKSLNLNQIFWPHKGLDNETPIVTISFLKNVIYQ